MRDRPRPDGRQPGLDKAGHGEEALGHNAICAGFQGQRQWTDYYPNGDFMEAILNSSFDWNGRRTPYVLATENDALNGTTMLFGHLLTNTSQMFADLRTYWSADAIERVSGVRVEGDGAGGVLHLINSGSATLDATGRQTIGGKPAQSRGGKSPTREAKAAWRRPPGTREARATAAAAGRAIFHPRRHARHDG